jgi:mannan endo-1,4-beta-mannosidase
MRTPLIGLLVLAASCAHAPTPAPAPPEPPTSFVTQAGGDFFLDGKRVRFVGVNVYSLASSPRPGGFACGNRLSDAELEALFREVAGMGATVVRFWAFQSYTEGAADFGRLDLIVRLARKHRLRLVPVLENQWADCSRGGYRLARWYRDGYRRSDEGYTLPFRKYVARVVERYRHEPAILMWQIMNEAEARSVDGVSDAPALIAFAADMSSLIKSIDRHHLVSIGTIGGGQPGTEGGFYLQLGALPWIDVIEAHEYEGGNVLPSEIADNCLDAARQLGKTCVIGEIGIPARDPDEVLDRADRMRDQIRAIWNAGVDGVILWSYRAGDGVHMDFDRNDPLYDSVKGFTRSVRGPP